MQTDPEISFKQPAWEGQEASEFDGFIYQLKQKAKLYLLVEGRNKFRTKNSFKSVREIVESVTSI